MMICIDTNVLLRLLVKDNELQRQQAVEAIQNASVVIVSIHTFCEAAWVLQRSYHITKDDVAAAFRQIIKNQKFKVDLSLVVSGLMILELGGDFADGVIFAQGQENGSELFLSFDKKAIKLLAQQGLNVKLLGT